MRIRLPLDHLPEQKPCFVRLELSEIETVRGVPRVAARRVVPEPVADGADPVVAEGADIRLDGVRVHAAAGLAVQPLLALALVQEQDVGLRGRIFDRFCVRFEFDSTETVPLRSAADGCSSGAPPAENCVERFAAEQAAARRGSRSNIRMFERVYRIVCRTRARLAERFVVPPHPGDVKRHPGPPRVLFVALHPKLGGADVRTGG